MPFNLLTPDYVGIPNDESKLVIQKSNRLLYLASSDLSLDQFKILDVFLSRIDSEVAEKNYVRFSKNDLERILGKDRIRPEILKKSLDGLLKNFNLIEDMQTSNRRIDITKLFEIADIFQDDSGTWQIDLKCSESAKRLFFDLKEVGYLRYVFSNIKTFSCRTSYLLYLFLEDIRQKTHHYEPKCITKTFIINITELKKSLGCENTETFKEFRHFNSKVLKKGHTEINNKTNLSYDYKPVNRTSKGFTCIEFTLLNINEARSEVPPISDANNLYNKAIKSVFIDFNFSSLELNNLNNALIKLSDYCDIENYLHNISEKIKSINIQSEINNPYVYILTCINNELKEQISSKEIRKSYNSKYE